MGPVPFHVLMIVRSFALDGPGRLLADLLAAAEEGHGRFSVVALEREGPLRKVFEREARRLGGGVHAEKTGWATVRRSAGRVARLAERIGATHLHGHLLMADAVGRGAARRTGLPYLVTEHGLHGWSEKGRLLRPIVRAWYRATLRPGMRVAAISEKVRRELLRAGIQKRRITVVPNGVNLDRFPIATPEERASFRAALGIPAEAWPVMLVLGNLGWNKSPQTAVGAMAAFHDEGHKGAMLLFAGRGAAEHDAREEAANLGIAEQVLFAGQLEDPRVAIGAADVLVHPARSESFGLAMMEALAMGLPVVARAGAGPEGVLPANPLAHLVEGEDTEAWQQAIANAARVGREGGPLFAAACRRFVEREFPISGTLALYRRLYEESMVRAEEKR